MAPPVPVMRAPPLIASLPQATAAEPPAWMQQPGAGADAGVVGTAAQRPARTHPRPRDTVIWHHTIALPGLGALRLDATDRGLCGIFFIPHAEPGQPTHPHVAQAAAELAEYAAGCRRAFTVPLDRPTLPTGINAILDALAAVPFGVTISYGALAAAAGRPRAARLAGNAMARNPLPIVIPCHRVVAAHGVGGYSPGLAHKRRLWALEGLPWPCP